MFRCDVPPCIDLRLIGHEQAEICRLLAPSGGWGMSAIPPLSADEQTSGERGKNDASEPESTSVGSKSRNAEGLLQRFKLICEPRSSRNILTFIGGNNLL